MPFKANNNREAVVVCARHVVKWPSKRSVLVYFNEGLKSRESMLPQSREHAPTREREQTYFYERISLLLRIILQFS